MHPLRMPGGEGFMRDEPNPTDSVHAGNGPVQPVNGALPSLPSPTMPNFNMAQTPNGQPASEPPPGAAVYTNGLPQSYPPRK